MTVDAAIQPNRVHRVAFVGCAALVVLFAFMSYSVVLTKSATFDEPYHGLAAWTELSLGDFRMDYPNPPLAFYLAALPTGPNSLQFDEHDERWQKIPSDNLAAWALATHVLYQTPGNDGAKFINRGRLMMLPLAIVLATLLIIWSWQIGGPIAAIIAATLFAFDPNFLGHSPLIKNDVALAMGTLATSFAAWHAGRRLTYFRAIMLALSIAIAINTKFSGLALVPILCLLLLTRVFLPSPWLAFGRIHSTIFAKLLDAGGLLIFCAGVALAVTWASYGFRFESSNDPSGQLDMQLNVDELTYRKFQSQHPPLVKPAFEPNRNWDEVIAELSEQTESLSVATSQVRQRMQQPTLPPTMEKRLRGYIDGAAIIIGTARAQLDAARRPESRDLDLRQAMHKALTVIQQSRHNIELVRYCLDQDGRETDPFVRAARFASNRRVMPSAWINGLVSVYANAAARNNFLLGEIMYVGRWYYFPLAILFKTPVAILIGLGLALIAALLGAIRHGQQFITWLWPGACLMIPAVTILALAMTSNINLGLRHILPVFPLLYVGAAAIAAPAIWKSIRWRCVVMGLAIMLIAESVSARPNYIAYFNFAARAWRDPIDLLGDSNLDWGQDLPLLAQWQKTHDSVPLAADYFGSVDPGFYGIHFEMLPPWPPPSRLTTSCVLAVSATSLQGSYGDEYREYRRLTPIAILGGTIYLYDLRAVR